MTSYPIESHKPNAAKVDLGTARVQYTTAVSELDAAKQVLRKIWEEHNASVEAKDLATEQAAKAENFANVNMERSGELSKEIAILQELIQQDKQKQSYKARPEESAKKLLALKRSLNPEVNKNLETQLAGIISEIEALQKEMEKARASDLDSVRTITMMLRSCRRGKLAKEPSGDP
ncbi:Hypothetical predicted protein [Olea europaea subsp. europaea]|uniref:Uncharacterized protein n=1 Tax=Olea europaea subsp. europaea TaxID=158383 RepID=A0A8S0STF3_OLEEU|nr:Hypothetical predicted protein [Olea europaea subsp. europaea]